MNMFEVQIDYEGDRDCVTVVAKDMVDALIIVKAEIKRLKAIHSIVDRGEVLMLGCKCAR